MARNDIVPWTPRGLNRDEAAYYIGVGSTKFDELVRGGQMPKPKRIGGRVVWDRAQLDLAFSEIGNQPRNVIDDALHGRVR